MILLWFVYDIKHFRGAGKVVTLEYGQFISEFPNHEFIRPQEFREQYLAGTLGLFDAVFTYSSVEHSGLGKVHLFLLFLIFISTGRYGDSLNPWGDIITIAQAWCVSTPQAKLAIGVPTSVNEDGGDVIHFNAAKRYGPRLYPFLVTNWKFMWPKEGFYRFSKMWIWLIFFQI